MLKIEKLNDKSLEIISGGMIHCDEIKEKADPNYLEIGILSEILGISIAMGTAQKYAEIKKFRFKKKAKTILIGALIGCAVTGIGLGIGAGIVIAKKFINHK